MTVLLARAPANSRARSIRVIVPEFQRRASDGQYLLIGKVPRRMTVVLTEGATAVSRVAAVIPFDADLARRTEAMLQLSRILEERLPRLASDAASAQAQEAASLEVSVVMHRSAASAVICHCSVGA